MAATCPLSSDQKDIQEKVERDPPIAPSMSEWLSNITSCCASNCHRVPLILDAPTLSLTQASCSCQGPYSRTTPFREITKTSISRDTRQSFWQSCFDTSGKRFETLINRHTRLCTETRSVKEKGRRGVRAGSSECALRWTPEHAMSKQERKRQLRMCHKMGTRRGRRGRRGRQTHSPCQRLVRIPPVSFQRALECCHLIRNDLIPQRGGLERCDVASLT